MNMQRWLPRREHTASAPAHGNRHTCRIATSTPPPAAELAELGGALECNAGAELAMQYSRLVKVGCLTTALCWVLFISTAHVGFTRAAGMPNPRCARWRCTRHCRMCTPAHARTAASSAGRLQLSVWKGKGGLGSGSGSVWSGGRRKDRRTLRDHRKHQKGWIGTPAAEHAQSGWMAALCVFVCLKVETMCSSWPNTPRGPWQAERIPNRSSAPALDRSKRQSREVRACGDAFALSWRDETLRVVKEGCRRECAQEERKRASARDAPPSTLRFLSLS